MTASVLLVAAPAWPLLLLVSCLTRGARDRMTGLLWLAPLPALAAAAWAEGAPAVVLDWRLARITLALDLPAALLLGAASLLWIAAGAYARTYLRGRPDAERFAVFWLLTLTGSIGVFICVDIAGFFLSYCLVSLAAWGLVVHAETPRAWRAGGVYVAFAILGETLLLMGLVLLAASTPGERLLIRDAVAALPGSPWRGVIPGLLIAGFGAKIALLPLHVWMPLTYRAAPIPAAAVLSGAGVKAGVIGLIRFLPLSIPLPFWGDALIVIGLAGAYWGVVIGITQDHPKTVLAYSSISQMGFIAALFGAALAAGEGSAATPIAFYAVCHVLVKGSLFLAAGVAAAEKRRRNLLVLLPAGILGLGLAGLPLTGLGLGKLAVKAILGGGAAGLLGTLAAAGTTLLMLHFLARLAASETGQTARAPSGLLIPWLTMAVAGVVLPWVWYGTATGGALSDVLKPGALWSGLWPVLIGIALALLLQRSRLPRIPEGDVIAMGGGIARAATECGAVLERADGVVRQWPISGLLLLLVAMSLGLAMFLAH